MKNKDRFDLTKVGGRGFTPQLEDRADGGSSKLILAASPASASLSLGAKATAKAKLQAKGKRLHSPNNNRSHEGEYTLQSHNDTWQQFGKVPPALERPATRKEIKELHARLDKAMHLSQRDLRKTRPTSTGLVAEQSMEQDVLAVSDRVKKAVEACEGAGGVGHELALATALFEQKWADIILGEVEEQVNVACLEQGKLLGKVRRILASGFKSFEAALFDALDDVKRLNRDLNGAHASAKLAKEKLSSVREDVKKEYDELVFRIQRDSLEKQRECEAETREAEALTEQASEALIALNGILRSMKADSEGVRTLELNETCRSLTCDLQVAQRKIRELSKVKEQNEKLTSWSENVKSENEELNEKVTKLEEELKRRDQLVEGLLAKEAAAMVERELAAEGNSTGIDVPVESSEAECSGSESGSQWPSEDEETVEQGTESTKEETPEEEEQEELVSVAAVTKQEPKETQATTNPPAEEPEQAKTAARLSKKKSLKGKRRRRMLKKKSKRKIRVPAAESPYVVGKKLLATTDTIELKNGKDWVDAQLIPERAAAAARIRGGMDASAAICVRCKAEFDSATDVDALFERGEKRLPCTSYRILLPNLMGYKPQRVRGWVLRCMRCVLRSKRRQDFANDRVNQPRRRLAEYLYSWFTPRPSRLAELEELQGKDAARMALAKADEHRWGFFYGLKVLAPQLREADLFYAFLDEKYGEDDFAFYIHVVTVVEAVTFERVERSLEWGLCTDAPDCDGMEQDLESADCREEDQVPELVLVDVKCAKEVVKRVMSKAGSGESKRVLKSLLDNVAKQQMRIDPSSGNRVVDLNVVVRVLLQEYRNEQAHRKAAMRVMFGAATSGEPSGKTVDLQQLSTIVKALNSTASTPEAAELYRLAHELGNGKVNLRSFARAAEMTQFFTKCLRLPAHFGTEAPNVLRFKERTRIGTIVRTSMLIMEDTLENARSQLDPGSILQLERLCTDVKQELAEGRIVLDGRRSLCALRRLMHFLLGERINRREIYGEPWLNGRSVAIVEKELHATIQILSEFEESEKKGLLERIRSKWSAAAIQRNWRKKHATVLTIPSKLRELISGAFEAKAIVSIKGKRLRVASMPQRSREWTRRFVSEIYAYMQWRERDQERGILGVCFLTLEEAVHEVMLCLYGVRSFAERQLYDLLLGTREHAKEDIRLRCFAAFLGLKLYEQDTIGAMDVIPSQPKDGEFSLVSWYNRANFPEQLHDSAALHTYLVALEVLCSQTETPISSSELVTVSVKQAEDLIKEIFQGALASNKHKICGARPSKAALETALTLLQGAEKRGNTVRAEDVLLCVLQGWLMEQNRREEALLNISTKLQGRGFHNVENIVSFVDFQDSLAPFLFDAGQMSVNALMHVYTRIMNHSEPSATLTLYGIKKALEELQIYSWRPPLRDPRRKTPAEHTSWSPSDHNSWALLRDSWEPLQEHSSYAIGELEDRARSLESKEGKSNERAINSSRLEDLIDATRTEHDKFCERYFQQGQAEEQSRSAKEVGECWKQLRKLLEAWQRLRHRVGAENDPFEDKWDLAQGKAREGKGKGKG